jgi:glucose-6-phosphate-specific signal transduction histidine kinase
MKKPPRARGVSGLGCNCCKIKEAVSIRDNGIGAANPAGSGITGLRDRVEALGGTFKVDSDPGQGTVGICQLPTTLPSQRSW